MSNNKKMIILRTNVLYSVLYPFMNLIFCLILIIGVNLLNKYVIQINDLMYNIIYGIVAILILKYLYKFLFIKSFVYTLTGEQIIYEYGVFSKKKERLEMYRVKDITEIRTFSMRMINAMTLKLITSDKTDPEFFFKGIDKSNMGEVIRKTVEHQRKHKRVHEID